MNYYERHIGDWRLHAPGRWAAYSMFPALDKLPRFAGVYAVYINDALVYIGSSVDIANRFSEHKLRYGYGDSLITPWGDYPGDARVVLKVRRSLVYGDWAMWELRLIQRLRPVHNRRGLGRKAACHGR